MDIPLTPLTISRQHASPYMSRFHRFDLFICLTLAFMTVLVYWDLFSHQFVIIDDPVYVSQNPDVQSGFSLQGIKWAFTTTRAEFWHPLTWLSYMLDTQFFGQRPAGYLFTNLLLHVFNALLVFVLLKTTTHNRWQSAVVAAVFALHPLHVESVAWIAERKDVLSSFFWLLTTGAYIHYVRNPRPMRYLVMCLTMALGLMAKPMLVTLPFGLLLLDYWPLNRWTFESSTRHQLRSALYLIREKIPLFLMAAIFSLIAFRVQRTGGGIGSTDQYAFADRVGNAIISYTSYLGQMIWPHKLAVFYPFPPEIPVWKVAGAACLLVGFTILALKSARRYPFLIVGWLWYLGTLIPVIGLVKIGDFSRADRYMYMPLVGLAVILAWGIPAALARLPRKNMALTVAAVIALAALSWSAHRQVRIWTNSFTLLSHALEATDNNFYAHFGLGHAYAGQGRYDQAAMHFSKAIHIKPTKVTLYNDLGRCLAAQGKIKTAGIQFEKALAINPRHPSAHFYLANIAVIQHQFQKSIYHFSEALRFHSDFSRNRTNAKITNLSDYQVLVSVYQSSQKLDREIRHYHELLTDNAQNLAALRKLIIAYSVKGDYDSALALLRVDKSASGRIREITEGYRNWNPITRPARKTD